MGVIEKQSIQDIADAIRDRNGLTTLYKPRQMDEAIRGLYKTEAVNHVFDDLRVNTTKENTSFTLDDAEGEAEITELKGNTTQEGIPTPTSPVEVKTVSGDNEVVVTGENLFNTEYYKTATYNTQNFYAYTPLKVRGGRYLLIKVALKSGGTAVSGAYLNISSGYGTPASVNAGQTITGISNGTAVTRSLNFTENKLYLNIAGNIQDILNNYDIMLATSNIPYEPYTGNSYRVDLRRKE